MEDNTGIKSILKIHLVYSLLQEVVGGNEFRRKFITNYVRAEPGDKVVEIGCGPAQLFPWLPVVEYIGFDTNKDYIEAAQKKYGHSGLFLIGDTGLLENDQRLFNADIVICSAILHHLNDDEVFHAMKFAYKILRAGGKLVCGEPCWVPNQSFLSKWIMSNDRGKNIRTEKGYLELVGRLFSNVRTTLDMRALRIPTTGIFIECIK